MKAKLNDSNSSNSKKKMFSVISSCSTAVSKSSQSNKAHFDKSTIEEKKSITESSIDNRAATSQSQKQRNTTRHKHSNSQGSGNRVLAARKDSEQTKRNKKVMSSVSSTGKSGGYVPSGRNECVSNSNTSIDHQQHAQREHKRSNSQLASYHHRQFSTKVSQN